MVCLATDMKDDHVEKDHLGAGIYHHGEMRMGDVCAPRPIWFELDAYEPSLFEVQWILVSMNFPLISEHCTCGRQILVYRMAMPQMAISI